MSNTVLNLLHKSLSFSTAIATNKHMLSMMFQCLDSIEDGRPALEQTLDQCPVDHQFRFFTRKILKIYYSETKQDGLHAKQSKPWGLHGPPTPLTPIRKTRDITAKITVYYTFMNVLISKLFDIQPDTRHRRCCWSSKCKAQSYEFAFAKQIFNRENYQLRKRETPRKARENNIANHLF